MFVFVYKHHLLLIYILTIYVNRYNEEREQPELPRNMPPVSGRIFWIRFYDINIKRPMEVFKKHREVITHMVSY